MSRFHVDPEGNVRPCRARAGKCVYSSDSHGDSAAEVREKFERLNKDSLVSSLRGTARKTSRRMSPLKKFMLVSGAMATVFSMTACSHGIDTDEQESWKNWEQQKAEQDRQENREKAEKTYEEGKAKAKELYESGKEKAEAAYSEGRAAYDRYYGSSSEKSSSDTSDVFFQGGSLVPSQDEVSRAKDALSRLVVMPERDNGYSSKDDQWKFDRTTYSAVEMRDVTYNASFNDDGRAEDGSAFKDPYTGDVVTILKGSSYDADIDHIVPRSEISQSENPSSPLSRSQEHQITNDLDNLQLVGAQVNRQVKNDKDPAEFIPSYEPSQCVYVVRYIEVKAGIAPDGSSKGRPALTVDSAEKKALESVLNSRCY